MRPKMTIRAMLQSITSTRSQAGVSALEVAAKGQAIAFFVTVAWICVGAVITALLTFWLYKAQNRYQEIARVIADARTAEADAKAEEAKRDAALANQEAAKAMESAAQLMISLEEEARKRAQAERDLLELQERVRPRRLTESQQKQLSDLLRGKSLDNVEVQSPLGNAEASRFARDIGAALQAAGWGGSVSDILIWEGPPRVGVAIFVRSAREASPAAVVLQQFLNGIGIEASGAVAENLEGGAFKVVIGSKYP
jgi:F0F1-type ATP synthase membrane subunit b/b'